MKQLHHLYTTEDHGVWSELFHRQMDQLNAHACRRHLECLEELSPVMNTRQIPNYDVVNEVLMAKTGWQIHVVHGLIPVTEFYQLLFQRKFCAPAWIRSRSQMDYLEEPDLFHDVFGHIPLLMDEVYADYVQKLGSLGVRYAGRTDIERQLERIYWRTSEFGLILENGKVKVLGAGIMSSGKEIRHAMQPNTTKYSFDLEQVISVPFRTDELQPFYFVMSGFEELIQVLSTFEQKVKMEHMSLVSR